MSTRGRDAGSELPYTGPLGATRYEPAFLAGPDGVARRIDVVRAVNAATDPALAGAAVEGTLHRLEDGVELAVPIVFHDPGARRFALVVPASRAHEELVLRAELLRRLAEDTSSPLPAYVREARAVIGAEGLRRWLETERSHDGDARVADAQMSQREERLRDRAEGLLHREDELAQRSEELEIQGRDFQVREQELEQRLAELMAREEQLVDEARSLAANKSALGGRERILEAREAALEARERELDADGHGPTSSGGSGRPARVSDRVEAGVREGGFEIEPIDDEAEPMDDLDGEESGREEIEPSETVDEPTPLPGTIARVGERRAHEPDDAPRAHARPSEPAMEAEELDSEELEPSHGTPAADVPAAWIARGHDAYAAVIDGEVRLWSRSQPDAAHKLAQGGAALLLQAEPDSPLPLALLSVHATEGDERFARAVLDLTRPDDREVLETLARDFRVRLEVVSSAGRALGSYAVAGPGEANAQRVLAVLAARGEGAEDARRTEADRLSREGVRATPGDAFDPGFADEGVLASAAGATAAVRAYEPLLDPIRRDRLVLAHGVPAARIDALGKRVILAALRAGIELPGRLVDHAIKLGVAPDERHLAQRALTAYARTCESGVEATERTRGEASRAWGPLLAWATRAGAAVPDAAREALEALFDPEDAGSVPAPDARPVPDAAALEAMGDDELPRWIDHPAAREAVAREMARRSPSRFAPGLSRALRLLPTDAAADVVVAMVRAGDDLGDTWVELVGSQRPVAAGLAAVAAAVLHLRRALNPLMQRAVAADEPDWKLFGWAAGESGVAALKALSAGRYEGAEPDRIAWILAHVVRAGGGRDVEKTRAGRPGVLQDAATRAVGRVDEARGFDGALRSGAVDDGATDGERAARAMLGRIGKLDGGDDPTRAAATHDGAS